jgi:hypothetical protein
MVQSTRKTLEIYLNVKFKLNIKQISRDEMYDVIFRLVAAEQILSILFSTLDIQPKQRLMFFSQLFYLSLQ